MSSDNLEPVATLELLRSLVRLAPNARLKGRFSNYVQFEQSLGLSNCQLDFFMDINSAFEDEAASESSNFGRYLKALRDQQFNICKGKLARGVEQLGADAENLDELSSKIIKTGQVSVEELSIPAQSLASGIVDYLISEELIDLSQRADKKHVAQAVLKSVGQMCARVLLRLEPEIQVYRVGTSFRQIFGQPTVNSFIWSWLFNMQVCLDTAGDHVLDLVYQTLNRNF